MLRRRKGQPLAETVAKLEADGQTTVIIRRAGKFIGVIALADEPRPLAAEVMKRLRAQGIERLVMLTGDNASVARRVAEKIGITDVRAELLPGQKLTLIRELQHGSWSHRDDRRWRERRARAGRGHGGRGDGRRRHGGRLGDRRCRVDGR